MDHRNENQSVGTSTPTVTVVGGGLAGCEAAWQLTRRGCRVRLFEMRPQRGTEAHQTGDLAELVCSNSFRSAALTTAIGLLKEELRRLGSLIMTAADAVAIPAGAALAVDRSAFARRVTAAIESEPAIELVREEVLDLPEGPTVIASGPLTSATLSSAIGRLCGEEYLYFYDAIAPIVTTESIDHDIAFAASRWGHGGDDYINCPMTEVEYYAFVDAVRTAEVIPTRDFEKCVYFEGCMPIEEIARRGVDTLAYGPMRPVGLTDPRTGKRPYAVVQLRRDNEAGTLVNIVGFQTKMTYPEQRRVLRMIPGLANAEFVRLGSLHRNTFINSPRVLLPTLQVKGREATFIAGQLIGVEGYLESTAAGLLAGVNAARLVQGRELIVPPPTTAIGSLVAYVAGEEKRDFQPMNANYGLFPGLEGRARGKAKRELLAVRARRDLGGWLSDIGEECEEAVATTVPA